MPGERILASCPLHCLAASPGNGPQLVTESVPLAEAPRALRLAAAAHGSWGGGARVWVEAVRGAAAVWAWGGVEPASEDPLDAAFECAGTQAGDVVRVGWRPHAPNVRTPMLAARPSEPGALLPAP